MGPHLCGGDFCRYLQLTLSSHVDLLTELRLNTGLPLQVVLALQALSQVGERRFAILHPVPTAYLREATAADLAGMGKREEFFARSCSPAQAIDYAGLRAGLLHLASTLDFRALARVNSNAEVEAHFALRALARMGLGEQGLRAARALLDTQLSGSPIAFQFTNLAHLFAMDERAPDAAAPPPPVRSDAEYKCVEGGRRVFPTLPAPRPCAFAPLLRTQCPPYTCRLLWWVATALPFRIQLRPMGLPEGVPQSRDGIPADAEVYELTPLGRAVAGALGSDADLGAEIAPPAVAQAKWSSHLYSVPKTAMTRVQHHFHGSNAGNFFSM
jgi:hypothetical protein